jgi:hypothetical protein
MIDVQDRPRDVRDHGPAGIAEPAERTEKQAKRPQDPDVRMVLWWLVAYFVFAVVIGIIAAITVAAG